MPLDGPGLDELAWSPWVPLETAPTDPEVPREPGIYRIRSAETGVILYIGQTGRSLRRRLRELRHVYGDLMPYNDPHTAGPALWAHRIDTGETFEVSVAPLRTSGPERLGREALEITKRRMLDGCSPLYNFGRMPAGWYKSTGSNTKATVAAGKYLRGGRIPEDSTAQREPDPSAPPPRSLDQDPRHPRWLDLHWNEADHARPERDVLGVYRILGHRSGPLDYLGEGRIRDRCEKHLSGWAQDLAAERGSTAPYSWSGLDVTRTQRLEVENDLIASHMVVFGMPPRVQFQNGG
jgi:hypothetical protein